MKAIVIERTGGPEVLTLQDVNEPAAVENWVKIRVHAFGLNRAEVYFRQGSFGNLTEPRIPGIEAAGEVMDDSSSHFRKGQRVVTAMGGLMMARHGSYAEYVVAPISHVLAIDADMAWAELASLPMAYLTAWGALDKNLRIEAGQTLLIRGATSSVGLAALSYAKARGLTVIATTRSANKVDRLKTFGADHVLIDHGELSEQVRSLVRDGVDMALEIVGASTLRDTLKTLRHWGEVAVIGLLGGPPVIENFNLMADLPNTVKLSFFSSSLLGSAQMPLAESPLNWIAQQVSIGKIPSILSQQFNFSDIQQAHAFMESNEANGKLVGAL